MISILVPNYNRGYILPLILQQYEVMRGPRDFEVVIVDDVSDDDSEAFLHMGIERVKPSYPVRAYRIKKDHARKNVCRTINVCAKKAEGDLFLFNPSDVLTMGRDVLNKIRAHHAEKQRLYLTGRLVSTGSAGISTRNYENNNVGGGFIIPGGSISREFFEYLGGHDERYTGYGNADTDWTSRIIYGHQEHGGTHLQDVNIFFLHLEAAHLIRPGNRDDMEELNKIALENAPKGIYRVNPDGWGDAPTERIYP